MDTELEFSRALFTAVLRRKNYGIYLAFSSNFAYYILESEQQAFCRRGTDQRTDRLRRVPERECGTL